MDLVDLVIVLIKIQSGVDLVDLLASWIWNVEIRPNTFEHGSQS